MDIAYLGPVGTYSHMVAKKRFGSKASLIPLPSVPDVCRFVSGRAGRKGIVPIENSSGGQINETVDVLLTRQPPVHVEEELQLNVTLALLGHSLANIRTLYSHFVPLEHCSQWIRQHLPKVHRIPLSSTAAAAAKAAEDPCAAALGSRTLAGLYGLKVLCCPVQADMPNLTTFLVITGRKTTVRGPQMKTTLAANLPNTPGSLCSFLEVFRNQNVNLSRIISRPIRGCPKEYAFLVDIQGDPSQAHVKNAIFAARKTCTRLRTAGVYPVRAPYQS